MRSMNKFLTGAALAVAMTVASVSGVSASEQEPSDVGGWEEGSEVSSNPGNLDGSFSVHAAKAKHTGKAESKTIKGTTNKRSHGWTTWKGVKHYTTARLEHYWPNKGVIASSGRKWGKNGTEATTKWVPFNPNKKSNGYGKAKTYYGR